MKRQAAGLTSSLIRQSVLPLLFLGLVVLLVSSYVIYTGIEREIENNLKVITKSTYRIYDLLYPGEYYRDDQGMLYKGGVLLDGHYDLLDEASRQFEADITLFYGDKRLLTSIRDQEGQRAVRTEAAPEVSRAVLEQQQPYFSNHVSVNGVLYFGYYLPITNSDGAAVGMMFAGKPRSVIMPMIYRNILGIFVVTVVVMLAAGAVSVVYGRRIVAALSAIKDFLKSIASGDLKAHLDEELLKRQDEIGEMGRFSVMLQDSVTQLVGTDPLTGLYNRRSCGVVLEAALKSYRRRAVPFVLAIGDIDHFKRVNDCYGHQAGDQTLQELAVLFKEHMERKGFVFRFGGEEFLFIYEAAQPEEVINDLKALKEKISLHEINTNQICFSVNMTFGLASCTDGDDIDALIRLADDNLYYGKNNGRNHVVYQHKNY